MLLVYHYESEVRECDGVLYECVRPEYDVCLARLESLPGIFLHAWCERADEEIGSDAPLHEPGFTSSKMLAREDFCRRHDSDLEASVILRHEESML